MTEELRALGEPYATAVQQGLGAIARSHRSHVAAASPRRLTGSIDLDTTLSKDPNHANAHRWDYGVGFHVAKGRRRCAVWIEVHPANPGAVEVMLRKASWLRAWLARRLLAADHASA